MRIREEQLRALRQSAEDRFELRVFEHIQQSPFARHLAFHGGRLREFVRYGIARARSWRMESEKDIFRFIYLLLILSPTFDEDPDLPWIRAILKSEGVSPTLKINRVWIGTGRLLRITRANLKSGS